MCSVPSKLHREVVFNRKLPRVRLDQVKLSDELLHVPIDVNAKPMSSQTSVIEVEIWKLIARRRYLRQHKRSECKRAEFEADISAMDLRNDVFPKIQREQNQNKMEGIQKLLKMILKSIY